MKAVYLYPITGRNFSGITNPYISLLAEAIGKNFEVINKDHPSQTGVLDLIKYLRRIDIVYFNWIEDLPEKKGGMLQTALFFSLFLVLKICRIRVLWTLHNKESHSKRYPAIKRMLYRLMLHHSDLVLTHASDGVEMIPSNTSKVFLPHPVKHRQVTLSSPDQKKYDIIIWGTIARYKGIDAFLEYLKQHDLIRKFEIMITGKIVEADLERYLTELSETCDNISLINKFLDQEELDSLILQSKIILFTYHSDSILSSGALMDSLIYGSIVIGPETGAFKDLASEGMIYVYKDLNDLPTMLSNILSGKVDEKELLDRTENFIQQNSWDRFAEKIHLLINDKLMR